MIIGIGTDIVDHRRIQSSINRFGERFTSRIFTEAEQEAALSRHNPALYFAKRYAAKEAVYKILHRAGVDGLGWREAEFLNDERGAPRATLTGHCKTALERLTPDGYKPSIDVSLSDEPPYAVAFVVISAVT